MLENIKNFKYNVAIYIRLSKEDADRGYDESESITNQKSLLTEYVKNLGNEYTLVDMYIDPGYTGTNFNRPDFKRMINDINIGKVNMVVTKDLSRLGRDYIETGEYIEKWFPEKNIRYVSVTDGIDTFANNNSNNDIAPFKAILNDMYSKDLSKKIKTALNTKQRQGKWVGAKTPIGYKKDPNDRNKLIIDEEEAKIVRIIFDMASEGKQVGTIKKYLNDNNIPTANGLRYNKDSFWENKTVKQVLRNKVYIGVTEQNKRSRVNYKNRKLRANPEEEWYTVENTHMPIIDKEVFERVQKLEIVQKYDRNEKKHKVLLDGLMFCYECHHKIGVKAKKVGQYYMTCNNYRRYPTLKLCTSHGFSYSKLEELVLNTIRKMFLDLDNKKIELNIKKKQKGNNYKMILKKLYSEITIQKDNLDKMYVDKLNNKISEEMYDRISKKISKEIEEKRRKCTELEELQNKSKEDNDKELEQVIKDFLKMEKPTPELMRVIINRIEIHQDKQVDIQFNFKELNYFLNQDCLI